MDLSQSSRKHMELLTHPVIDSFLLLKWMRIRIFYFLNISIYICFSILLTVYAVARASSPPINAVSNVDTPTKKYLDHLSGWILFMSLMRLLKLLYDKITRTRFRYVGGVKEASSLNFSDYLNFSVHALTIVLIAVFWSDPDLDEIRYLSAVCVLQSWTLLMFKVGGHPGVSSYLTMFVRVAMEYAKILVMYFVMVMAFGLAFYIMFQKAEQNPEYPFFEMVWLAVVKVLTMSLGEIDPNDTYTNFIHGTSSFATACSSLVYLTFLFLIPLVMLNLLNGLAVSEIADIKAEGETDSAFKRLRKIAKMEAMLYKSGIPGVSKFLEFAPDVGESQDMEDEIGSIRNGWKMDFRPNKKPSFLERPYLFDYFLFLCLPRAKAKTIEVNMNNTIFRGFYGGTGLFNRIRSTLDANEAEIERENKEARDNKCTADQWDLLKKMEWKLEDIAKMLKKEQRNT